MKTTIGVLAVLSLVTTLAIGQQYQETFPQSANPALANGTAWEPSASVNADLPASMAANLSSMNADRSDKADLGSPFPSVANPSLGRGTAGQMSPDEHNADSGSPFPNTANPSSNW
jgi:hypothetical protein